MMNPASRGTVVFVLWEGLHVVSGVTSWVGVLRTHLEARGWQVRVIVSDPSSDAAVLGKPDGVFVSLQQLRGVLESLAPATVVLMNVLRQSMFGPVIASLNRQGSRLHAISVLHSDEHDEYYRHLPAMAPWVHHIIAVSPVIATKTLTQLPPGSTMPVSALACGVDCPRNLSRSYQTNPIRLVHFGRLVQKQKRVFDLAVLADALLDRGVAFTFAIYGQGSEEEPLRERLAEHTRAGRVLFGGKLQHGELLQRLAAYDVFVNVSEYEGTSVAMLEAMAKGCVPVVTHASSGVAELITPGENGFHVPVGDIESLAARIAELAGGGPALELLGVAARRTVEQGYAMEAYVDRFTAILDSVRAHEPIRTSAEVEQLLAYLLPIEANATTQAVNLRNYVDWRLDAQFHDLDSRLAALRLTARLERAIAPVLRRLKRMIVR